MKKTRTNSNKGITLIALVITIIVLLILAAVSIATLTGENGILTKANDAKTNNTIGEEKEQIGLAYNAVMADNKGSGVTAGQLQDELKKYDSEITVADEEGSFTVKFPNGHVYTVKKDGTIDDSAVGGTTPPTEGTTILKPGDTATKTETDNYEDTNEEKATIPKDFKVSEEDNTIDTGLVVTAPDGSEFVWVPVPNAVSENINDKPIAREIEDLKGQNDTNGNKYYQGILYSFSSSESTEMTDYGQGTTSWREPSLVTHDDRDTKALYGIDETIAGNDDDADTTNYNTITPYTNVKAFGKAMQEDYNSMVASVIKYKGFYVGRYETSLVGVSRKAQSKTGITSMSVVDVDYQGWYGMYAKQKDYASDKDIENIVGSSMIWGSQYDAMLNWMLTGSEASKVTETIPEHSLTTTGSTGSDVINQIYDLGNNLYEWTLEARSSIYRVIRGGCYNYSEITSSRSGYNPNVIDRIIGSRLALYIK